MARSTVPDPGHICERSERSELKDAWGIFCCFICPDCEGWKRAKFRAEIFEDANYQADEPIDED
jgi:hypothetical protein